MLAPQNKPTKATVLTEQTRATVLTAAEKAVAIGLSDKPFVFTKQNSVAARRVRRTTAT